MKRLLSVTAALFLMLVTVASPASAQAILPVNGTISTQVEFLGNSLAIHGVGQVTPLGQVTAESTQTVSGDPLQPQAGARVFSEDLVIKSVATQEELHGGYSLVITSVDRAGLQFRGWIWFDGGTGRFEGASGGGRLDGGFSFIRQAGFYTIRTIGIVAGSVTSA